MQSDKAGQTLKLIPISPEGIPGALSKAETYRFLNEPWQAESICRDVIAIHPTNQAALILLILTLTDQFEHGVNAKEALQIAAGLTDDYHRSYYSGIIHERQAIAEFRRHPDWRSRRQAHILFQSAMESYRQALVIRPPGNDEAALRWNACIRFLERNWGFQ